MVTVSTVHKLSPLPLLKQVVSLLILCIPQNLFCFFFFFLIEAEYFFFLSWAFSAVKVVQYCWFTVITTGSTTSYSRCFQPIWHLASQNVHCRLHLHSDFSAASPDWFLHTWNFHLTLEYCYKNALDYNPLAGYNRVFIQKLSEWDVNKNHTSFGTCLLWDLDLEYYWCRLKQRSAADSLDSWFSSWLSCTHQKLLLKQLMDNG